MPTKTSTSTAKRAVPAAKKPAAAKKASAKSTKPAASAKPKAKGKPRGGFLKSAGKAVSEVVATIADGAVTGVATAAKDMLDKQINTSSKNTSGAAAKKTAGPSVKKTTSSKETKTAPAKRPSKKSTK